MKRNTGLNLQRLQSETSDGRVIVTRVEDTEFVDTFSGGRQYFRVQVFRDDDITNPIGNDIREGGQSPFWTNDDWPNDADTVLQNIAIYDEHFNLVAYCGRGEPESLFKHNLDGTRQKDADENDVTTYNEEARCFEFDSYLWDVNFNGINGDLHPMHPPYREGNRNVYARIWDEDEEKYVTESTSGYWITANVQYSRTAWRRILTKEEKENNAWPRINDPGNIAAPDWDEELKRKTQITYPCDVLMVLPYARGSSSFDPDLQLTGPSNLYNWGSGEEKISNYAYLSSINWSIRYFMTSHQTDESSPSNFGDKQLPHSITSATGEFNRSYTPPDSIENQLYSNDIEFSSTHSQFGTTAGDKLATWEVDATSLSLTLIAGASGIIYKGFGSGMTDPPGESNVYPTLEIIPTVDFSYSNWAEIPPTWQPRVDLDLIGRPTGVKGIQTMFHKV